MRVSAFLVASALAGLMLVAISGSGEEQKVELALLHPDNWNQMAPAGKETDAIYGDAVLRNSYLTAVIAAPLAGRNANMTVRDVGGGLIDLTSRNEQSDQLAAFLPGRRASPLRSWTFSVNDREEVPLDSQAHVQGAALQLIVRSQGSDDRPEVRVAYRLGEADRFLTVTTRFANVGSRSLTIPLQDEFLADGRKEYMTKSDDGEGPEYWVEDRFWRQAYGVRGGDRLLQFRSDGRSGLIRYLDDDGRDEISLAPGEAFELTRLITCGPTRMHVTANFERQSGAAFRAVTLRVRDGLKRALQGAQVEVLRDGVSLGQGRANREGELLVPLRAGDYVVRVSHHGVVFDDIKLHVGQPSQQSPYIICDGYRPGNISVAITGEDGQSLPCKVAFIGKNKTPSPEFGPETAAFGVRNLRYTPDGKFIEKLSPGLYQIIVSRGPEYDAIIEPIKIEPGQNTPFERVLRRSVETSGWISSDFHGHSSPSGDNTSSQQGRVLNLVCEHIEFAPCTEHNRVSWYQRHFDRLGINEFISSVPGIELTGQPLPLNHQNAFPMIHHQHYQDGGGPQTDSDVEAQVRRLVAWDNGSEKLIQQNHPDIGWLFFDKSGDGEYDHGHEHTDLLDVIEIHPVEKVLDLLPRNGGEPPDLSRNRVFHWLQLLNQGFRIPGVVNSDAHYNFHGSGGVRNWIQCSTDNPAEIDALEIVRASEEGRLIMSNGPFLRVSARAADSEDTISVGGTLPAPDGKIELDISVQCPNWFDIDTVFVLVNGRVRRELVFTRESSPDDFSARTVRFRKTIPLELTEDAHIIVAAGGTRSQLGPVMGPQTGELPPAAFTNPLYVDIDGDGFKPNKDTLDHPLPVKQQ